MSRRPRLHLDDLADDTKLGAAIDGLFIENDNYAKLTRKILAAQDRLQTLCGARSASATRPWLTVDDKARSVAHERASMAGRLRS